MKLTPGPVGTMLLLSTLGILAVSPAAMAGNADGHTRCATYLPGIPGKADLVPLSTARSIDPGMTPYGPPPDPGIGDSWLWYVWHLAGAPWAELKSATVRGMGANCYVVVEDSQWNVSMNQADVDAIVNAFENESVGSYPAEGVWELNTGTFGPPPNPLDMDPRVYLFYYDFDVAADGFFWAFDQYPDGTQPYASNECDVVYLDCVTSDPGGDYMIAVMAHEFSHMIHFARDEDEAPWTDEGIAEYAMWMYGNPDPLGGFAANPDNDLTSWGGSGADYQQTYLYMLYLHERFGGRPALSTLIYEPGNSIPGVTNALTTLGTGETFDSVFRDWCVANFLDDTTIGDGRYGYAGETIPHMNGRRFTTYPQSLPSTSVSKWAADYITWVNGAPCLGVNFNGVDTGAFTVYLVQMGAGPSLVERKTLTVSQDGSWSLPGFSTWVDSVLMVIEDPRAVGPLGTYTFGASIQTTGAVGEGAMDADRRLSLDMAPNPSHGEVRMLATGTGTSDATVTIFDSTGRRVAELVPAGVSAGGEREFSWNGRDASGAELPAGIYWARLTAGGSTAAGKLVITK